MPPKQGRARQTTSWSDYTRQSEGKHGGQMTDGVEKKGNARAAPAPAHASARRVLHEETHAVMRTALLASALLGGLLLAQAAIGEGHGTLKRWLFANGTIWESAAHGQIMERLRELTPGGREKLVEALDVLNFALAFGFVRYAPSAPPVHLDPIT
jgi:hypothetical protein